jgi:hypothetical protein
MLVSPPYAKTLFFFLTRESDISWRPLGLCFETAGDVTLKGGITAVANSVQVSRPKRVDLLPLKSEQSNNVIKIN